MQLWSAFLRKVFLLPTWLIFSYYSICIATYPKLVSLIFFFIFSCPVNYWKLFHHHRCFKPFESLFVFSLYSCKLPLKLLLISFFHWRLLNLINTDIRSTFATNWFLSLKKWSTQIQTDMLSKDCMIYPNVLFPP